MTVAGLVVALVGLVVVRALAHAVPAALAAQVARAARAVPSCIAWPVDV